VRDGERDEHIGLGSSLGRTDLANDAGAPEQAADRRVGAVGAMASSGFGQRGHEIARTRWDRDVGDGQRPQSIEVRFDRPLERVVFVRNAMHVRRDTPVREDMEPASQRNERGGQAEAAGHGDRAGAARPPAATPARPAGGGPGRAEGTKGGTLGGKGGPSVPGEVPGGGSEDGGIAMFGGERNARTARSFVGDEIEAVAEHSGFGRSRR